MRRLVAVLFILLIAGASIPHAQDTRQFYLSPVDGDGTDANPYHSRCLGMAGAGNIDLRPTIDRFLCASDILPADRTGVTELGASLTSNLGAKKAALAVLLKSAIAANTVEELIVEMVAPRLKAGRDRKLKIYLGGHTPLYQQTAWVPFPDHGLVADVTNYAEELLEPAVAWATVLATETFNCADNASLTCVLTWTEFKGTDLAIVSNTAKMTAATGNEARADSDLATDDMEVTITMTAFVATTESRCGVIARKDSTATETWYGGYATNDGTPSASTWKTVKRVAGVLTTLNSNATDPVAGDTMKLRVDGSTVMMFVNGFAMNTPTTDTSISGNTRAGITARGAAASDSCTLDNFIAADYVGRSRGGALWLP